MLVIVLTGHSLLPGVLRDKVESMIEATERLGAKWLHGIRASETVFTGHARPG